MNKTIFLILLCIPIPLLSIPKPIIRTGITSYNYFKYLYENDSIYPSTIRDNLFISAEEKFTKFFKLAHRFDLNYSNYNKYSYDLNDLKAIDISNRIKFIFYITKIHTIIFEIKPTYYNRYGEEYYKQTNKLQYNLRLKYFRMRSYYSNYFSSREDDLFYHNINLSFYWYFPKKDFIKYKVSGSVYFQHYYSNDKKISPLKSARVGFEIVFDFNKMDLEDLYDKYKNEDEFFEE